jgi:hypothetical protein
VSLLDPQPTNLILNGLQCDGRLGKFLDCFQDEDKEKNLETSFMKKSTIRRWP